jgi:alpha-tubulin suppressor-like RCC1 family protein
VTVKNRKIIWPALLSLAVVLSLIIAAPMLNVLAADATVSSESYSPPECDVGDWTDIIQVATGYSHTVGLRSNGTVVAVGTGHVREEGEKDPWDVDDWANIVQVAAGYMHTVGLKSDGTVVTVGSNTFGQCEVGNWTDMVQIAAGTFHTVGLESNGTVVAVGHNRRGECNVGEWTAINQTTAGYEHTVGLKNDGTVVAVGYSYYGQCYVGNWTGIVEVAAGRMHTVGLKSDGTVVAVGDNDWGHCNVSGWTDVIQVAAGESHTVGLKSDGTVVAAGGYIPCYLPTSRCFIATAAYGTPMAEEIQILREFRDEYLLTNTLGQALVDLYYRVSPPIAEFITEHPGLRPVVRLGLVPAVAMSTVVVNTTPVEKAAVLGLLALVSVIVAVWMIRRRDRSPLHT